MTERVIKSIEPKFIIHRPGRYDKDTGEMLDDIHYVKERIVYEDGTKEKKLSLIRNYKRPFWITIENFRRHKTKKEDESIDRLRCYESTETDLWKNVAGRLGGRYLGAKTKRQVADSPYIYGCDVNSKVFLKKDYIKKYGTIFSKYEVATLDIETNIETDEITIISISRINPDSKEFEVFTVISKELVKNELNIDSRLKKIFKDHIPLENVNMDYLIIDDELDLFKTIMSKAHEWQPDFLAIWNIDFEITMFQNLCKKYNVKMEDIVSDPRIPPEDRYFKYKKGSEFRVTASGKRMTFEPKDIWNVVYASSSFYWIDAMTAYSYIRAGRKLVPTGYSLDSILGHELGSKYKKLKFQHLSDTDLGSVEWHMFMSKKFPLEYTVYNQWDVLSMLVLDEQTKDLNTTLPVLSGINPFDIFNSNPKKIVNELMFVYLDNNRVIGTNGNVDNKEVNEDEEILGLKDWIITLNNNFLNSENSIKCIKEDIDLETNIRRCVSDSDQVSGYPSNGQAANVSKKTTTREIITIKGIKEDVFKQENINLTMGPVSSLQYCQTMMNFPLLEDIEKFVKNKLKEEK